MSEGLMMSMNRVPMPPTTEERKRPESVRSRRYHKSGLARVRVRDSWSVVSHGKRRMAKATPTKEPMPLIASLNLSVHFPSSLSSILGEEEV